MQDGITALVKDGPRVIDVMGWLSRAALEYIGRGGLGHSFGPLDDDNSTAYGDAIRKIGYCLKLSGASKSESWLIFIL
jgi:hypothetical protein